MCSTPGKQIQNGALVPPMKPKSTFSDASFPISHRLTYTCFAMRPKMTKTERVYAALQGEEVDRVPVSAWWHDFAREWSAEDLAETTLGQYRQYDWDFIKVNPRASYFGEAFGAKYVQRE